MSLRIWLPLVGNVDKYKNFGLDGDATISMNGTYETGNYETGKLSNSPYKMTNSQILVPFENFGACVSIAFWVMPSSPATWSDILSFGDGNNRIEKSSDTGYTWYNNSNTKPVITSGTGLFSLTNNEYAHIAITTDGSKFRCYKNGVLVKEVAQLNSWITCADTTKQLRISGRMDGTSKYAGYIQDFRIYDHTLSVKEIYELKLGLMYHFMLNNPFECNKNSINLYNNYINGKGSASSWTMTVKSEDAGTYTKYTGTYTGTGSAAWWNLRCPEFSFTAGKTYWYSLKIRVNKMTNGAGLYIRKARCVNDYYQGQMSYMAAADIGRGWIEVKGGQVLNSTFTGSGKTVTTHPCIEIYSVDMKTSGTKFEYDFDIKEFCVYESPEYMGFINNNWATTFVSNSGTHWANLSTYGDRLYYSPTSKKYQYAARFGMNSYNELSTTAALDMSKATISFWVHPYKESSARSVCLFSTNSASKSVGIDMLSTSTSTDNRTYSINIMGRSASASGTITATIPCGSWSLITLVYDGSTFKYYKNGSLVTSLTYAGGNIYLGTIKIGVSGWSSSMYENCKLNDFRIYSSSLTADDVLKLYSKSADIDKKGNFHTGEYLETGSTTQIDRKVITKSKTLEEGMYYTDCNFISSATNYRTYPYTANEWWTPGTGTNSCKTFLQWNASKYGAGRYRVIVTMEFVGFTQNNSSGTFKMWWQGVTYNSTDGWNWTHNNQLVIRGMRGNGYIGEFESIAKAGGIYTWNSVFDITADEITGATYQNLAIRSDYSNGTGKCRCLNAVVIPESKYNEICKFAKTGQLVGNILYED